jgi:hypothetical protein
MNTEDRQGFEDGVSLLQDHYTTLLGRPIQLLPPILDMWWDSLRPELSLSEFRLAVRQWILSSPFFPCAQNLIEKAKGDREALGLFAWIRVLDFTAGMGVYPPDSPQLAEYRVKMGIDAACDYAVAAVGGYVRVSRAPEKNHPWLQKDFIQAYKNYSPERDKLTPPQNGTQAIAQITPSTPRYLPAGTTPSFSSNQQESEPVFEPILEAARQVKGMRSTQNGRSLDDQLADLNRALASEEQRIQYQPLAQWYLSQGKGLIGQRDPAGLIREVTEDF